MSAEEFTNMIFQKIDVNNDGKNLGFLDNGRIFFPTRECRIRRGVEHTTEELSVLDKLKTCLFFFIYTHPDLHYCLY